MHSLSRLFLTLVLVFTRQAYAAHVQFKHCNGQPDLYSDDHFNPNTLKAFLEKRNDETLLSFQLMANYLTPAACERSLLDNASVEVSLGAVGGTKRYNGEIENTTCKTMEY